MVSASSAARAAGSTEPQAARVHLDPEIPGREATDVLQHLFEMLQSTLNASGSVDDFGFDPEFT